MENKFIMENLCIQNLALEHFKSAKYASDVRFMQSTRPMASHDEAKPYYSVKHQLHEYKSEILSLQMVCVSEAHFMT